MFNAYQFRTVLSHALCESENSYTVEEVLSRFHSPHLLWDATEQELMEIRGIGKSKARQILSAIHLAKMLNTPSPYPHVIRKPEDVFNLVRHELGYLQKEHFVCLFLNTKNHLIDKETVSIGSLNSTIVHPREVYRAAIKRAAASIICCHNHPSGDTTPSQEDIMITSRLAEAGKIIGIELLDHCVVSSVGFTSIKELGFM
ncbi:RadC family protein [Saccharibacillus qingshengii]|uniref:RadC family protein n=1 Tax=Saccharibacillus qingshengii TaxID=1763540 RepID=UPI001557A740|nr:DNA repair protein RadC [Saccharibacillus qingshengii]